MSAEAFKKYIKAEAAPIARLIFDLRNESEEGDYYYLKYNKRFQTLYACIYYNHGNRQWLEQSPFLPVLRGVEPYLDADSKGYLLATLDASSPWRADEVAFSTHIRQGKYTADSITPEQLQRVKKDCNAFFRLAENGYYYEMLDAGEPVVEKAIATRYEKLKEQQRLDNIKQNLHTATPEKPLTLFGNWKYDGTNLLGYNGKKYPQFDIPNLRETPYGVTDGRYVLALTYNDVTHEWYELLLETDPAKFRIMRKGEGTVYYKSADTVYTWKLQPMPGADAPTFKVLGPFHARDKNNL